MTLDQQLYASMDRWDAPGAIPILRRGANPNAYNGLLFESALRSNQEPLVREFLKRGAKATPKALEAALGAEEKSALFTRLLLDAGADPNAVILYEDENDVEDDSEDDADFKKPATKKLYTPLMIAALEEHFEAAKVLVAHGAKVNTRPEGGLTALQIAASKEEADFCNFLLDKGADPRGSQVLLLNCAVDKDAPALFDRLKRLGALPKPVRWPDQMDGLSLPIAQRMVRAGADPNGNPASETDLGQVGIPLMTAAQANDEALVRYLLDSGAKTTSAALFAALPGRYITPAQHKADEEAHRQDPFYDLDEKTGDTRETPDPSTLPEDTRTVELLLQRGADLYSKDLYSEDRFGNKPLHLVAAYNRVLTLRLLLKYGAALEGQNKRGQTALYSAAEQGALETTQALLAAGANIEARDDKGNTPLFAAVGVGFSRTIYFPISETSTAAGSNTVLQALLHRGADPNATNFRGATALHTAALMGNQAAATRLWQRGADLEATTSDGLTPLGEACLVGQFEMARWLVQHGANPDHAGPGGKSARLIASQPAIAPVRKIVGGRMTDYDRQQLKATDKTYTDSVNAGRKRIAEFFRGVPIRK